MRRISQKCVLLILVCVIGLWSSMGTLFAEAAPATVNRARVLFISSYSYAWETVPLQMQGIKSALPENTIIDYKFMDAKNVNSDRSRWLFHEYLVEFLNEVQPYDAVIVGDDDAFNFVMKYKEELFDKTPIIFEGVNNLENAYCAKEDGFATGVVETLSYRNTIQAATQLCPKATNLVAILDDSVTGQSERIAYYNTQKEFPELTFKEINASTLSRQELVEAVRKLNEQDILLFIMCSEDKDRIAYGSAESVKLVSDASSIPTFSIVSIGMGKGVLGGELVSQEKMGYEAGRMAKRILMGDDIEDIAIEMNAPKAFYFDAEQMEKFHISKKQVPTGAYIINQKVSYWEQNKEQMKRIILIAAALAALLIMLLVDNIRRRKLNGALERVKVTLEEASRYDVMTTLFNRRVFTEEVEKKIQRQEKFGILLMDLDNFKHINDSLGHNNGDVVLKELASRLKTIQDENFRAYRLAGDEFTAIIDSQNPDVLEAYAKEIQYTFRKPYILAGEKYMLHSSIGLAMYPDNGASVSQLVASADAAMYKVKNHGKGGIAFYDDTCDKENYERKKNVKI